MFQRWQVRIEKTECVRRFDYSDTNGALLFHNLVMKRLHSCPMHLGSEMMLRVVSVKKPNPVVKSLVAAHAPSKRFIRVTAIMTVVAVKIGKAMTEIPERKKETNVAPVKDAENNECRNEQD